MQVSAAPEALKADEIVAGSVKPSDATASIPPVSKKLLAKVRTRREIGGGAENGEEDPRPHALGFPEIVRAIAQTLEWCGEPHRRQRFEGNFGLVWRKRNGLHVERCDLRLVQVREGGASGQHFLAPVNGGFARFARGSNLALDQILLDRGEHAAGLFDFLEQRPCRFAKRLR